MWMDGNDSLGSFMSAMPKDLDNVVQGVQTYGFSESLLYLETQLWDLWQFFAEGQSMGLGFGLIAAAFTSRALFSPFIIYSVSPCWPTNPHTKLRRPPLC